MKMSEVSGHFKLLKSCISMHFIAKIGIRRDEIDYYISLYFSDSDESRVLCSNDSRSISGYARYLKTKLEY